MKITQGICRSRLEDLEKERQTLLGSLESLGHKDLAEAKAYVVTNEEVLEKTFVELGPRIDDLPE